MAGILPFGAAKFAEMLLADLSSGGVFDPDGAAAPPINDAVSLLVLELMVNLRVFDLRRSGDGLRGYRSSPADESSPKMDVGSAKNGGLAARPRMESPGLKLRESVVSLLAPTPMADVSAPEIREVYEDVRADKTETNWLLLDFEGPKSDKLKLTGSGSGGLEELKPLLKEDNASFAYVRISYANDKESQRAKFIFVTWIGPSCKVMRKAKISVQSSDVKQVLRAYSIDVPASSLEDLDEVRYELRRA
ncbi:hypothetical protein P7C70_g6235, partial [Phenoliferia sp. Uapishka_3]